MHRELVAILFCLGALSLVWSCGPPEMFEPIVVRAIAAGEESTCALKDGNVWCWGDLRLTRPAANNENPQVPFLVKELTGVTQIAKKENHTCVLLKDGTVQCWGFNLSGQLGQDSDSLTSSTSPVLVRGLGSATQAL